MGLTAAKITKLLTAGKPGRVHHEMGLYLDVRSATSASWVFRYNYGGRPAEVGLGSLKKVDLPLAEQLRSACLAELGAGRDPKLMRAAAKEDIKQAVEAARPARRRVPRGPTVRGIAMEHIHLITEGGLTCEHSVKSWLRSFHPTVLGAIAAMAPGDVTVDDVIAMMNAENARTVRNAEIARQRLQRLLDWAHMMDMIPVANWRNPAIWTGKLRAGVENRKKVPVKHYKGPAHWEIGALLQRALATPVNDVRSRNLALQLDWQVISVARPHMAEQADWADIDVENACWRVGAEGMKSRKVHALPLTERHYEILDELAGGAAWPASGPLFLARYRSIRREFLQSLQADIVPHGLRTTFRTWAQSKGYEMDLPTGEREKVYLYQHDLIERCLAHAVGNKTSRSYEGGDDFLEQRRSIMAAWAAYCGVVQAPRDTRPAGLRTPVRVLRRVA